MLILSPCQYQTCNISIKCTSKFIFQDSAQTFLHEMGKRSQWEAITSRSKGLYSDTGATCSKNAGCVHTDVYGQYVAKSA